MLSITTGLKTENDAPEEINKPSIKMEETNNVANYADREAFNKKIFDDELTGGKKLVRYTWIYRWEASSEFTIKLPKEGGQLPAKRTLRGKDDEQKRYLLNVLENCPNIIVYHKAALVS